MFQAFLQCETKLYLTCAGTTKINTELAAWRQRLSNLYRKKCLSVLIQNYRQRQKRVGYSSLECFSDPETYLVFNCQIQGADIKSNIHAVERLTPSDGHFNSLIPIRFVPDERIKRDHRFMLSFDALALSTTIGKLPLLGKIIYGSRHRTVKVKLNGLIEITRTAIEKISSLMADSSPPDLVLNKNCSVCEFDTFCRKIALDEDELSLLSGMTERQRKNLHRRGIFTITQLSYIFRPIRKRKRPAKTQFRYNHSLRALAIREGRIYLCGKPKMNISGNPVYLDVEGLPDSNFYYLIGMRVRDGDTWYDYSFWADDFSDERRIWSNFVHILERIENPQLIYYGNYEKVFFKRLSERYPDIGANSAYLNMLIEEALNVVSVIYARVYFPTYSNGLKDIAQYLGFRWSDSIGCSLNSVFWRHDWQLSKDPSLKRKLIRYNLEDCLALQTVTNALKKILYNKSEEYPSGDKRVVNTDSLEWENPFRFGRNSFLIPELDHVNRTAHWDYQRNKIYTKSDRHLKRISKKTKKRRIKALPINKVVEFPPSTSCERCRSLRPKGKWKRTRIIYDLKFHRTGLKRWVTKFESHPRLCPKCRAQNYSQHRIWTKSKYGAGLMAYSVYQIIELRIPQKTVAKSLNQLFGFNLHHPAVNLFKSRSADYYKDTYHEILKSIVNGRLIHADETKISVKGKNGYIWAFTNLEKVAYVYTETRGSCLLRKLLHNFQGVLVSDFYPVYNSIKCPQQKCLIHLIRDLSDDLYKEPFNEEFRELVQNFANLINKIVNTIDIYGLKKHHLQAHKNSVDIFFDNILTAKYDTEIAQRYKRRFCRNREKLFTFLSHEDIPWNNNNAEHAIKSIAYLRRIIKGTTSTKGIREYLILLSICETCKCKGISFLDFLLSGNKCIEEYMKQN